MLKRARAIIRRSGLPLISADTLAEAAAMAVAARPALQPEGESTWPF